MTERELELLRCIWHTDKEHSSEAGFDTSGDSDKGLLTCRGCRATFLVLRGIPILVEDALLTAAERAELTEMRSIRHDRTRTAS